MATVNLNSKFNFAIPQDWTWVPTETSASRIVLNDGTFKEEFLGNFSYLGDAVSGTISSATFSVNQVLALSMEGLQADAAIVKQYAQTAGDTQEAYAYLLSGNDTVNGSASADVLRAYGGADTVNGNGGNDSLAGGAGNDVLNGGSGIDTAVFSGNRAGYTVTMTGNAATVSDTVGTDGADTLDSVERLLFADTGLVLDIGRGANGGEMFRLYQAAFNRTPDLAGIGFWLYQMDNGVPLQAIAGAFMNSAEFRSTYGAAPTNLELMTRIYENVLHRAPDEAGLNFYVNVLNNHAASAADVLVDLANSDENYNATINLIANGFSYTPWG